MKLRDAEGRCVVLPGGTELHYHAVGRGLPVLLMNGLGGPREVWRELVRHFSDRYRFLFWEYRGLQAGDGSARVIGGVRDHAEDACAILDAEGVSRTAVIGWSMGVQVALELFHQAPDRIASLVLINGAPRTAWADGGARSVRGKVIANALWLLRRSPRLVDTALRSGLRAPEAFTWARRVGLVGERVDAETFAQIAGGFLQLDVPAYLEMLMRLAEYDASDLLSQIDVPTLVVAGDRDPFTSRASMERLANDVAGAEYLVLPGASHYVLLDQFERVNLRIEKFWNERGYRAEKRSSIAPAPA